MMKYSIILSLLFIGCEVKESPPIVIHDTIRVDVHDGGKSIEPTIKRLFIDYYKAGWMDGSNRVIDLHNTEKLTQYKVEIARKLDWRKMENEINQK